MRFRLLHATYTFALAAPLAVALAITAGPTVQGGVQSAVRWFCGAPPPAAAAAATPTPPRLAPSATDPAPSGSSGGYGGYAGY